MSTALANLTTVKDVDRTTVTSTTYALASANADMASLKRKITIQSNTAEKIDSSMGITSGQFFLLWEGSHQCILQVAKVKLPKIGNQGKQNGRER